LTDIWCLISELVVYSLNAGVTYALWTLATEVAFALVWVWTILPEFYAAHVNIIMMVIIIIIIIPTLNHSSLAAEP